MSHRPAPQKTTKEKHLETIEARRAEVAERFTPYLKPDVPFFRKLRQTLCPLFWKFSLEFRPVLEGKKAKIGKLLWILSFLNRSETPRGDEMKTKRATERARARRSTTLVVQPNI